MKSNITISINVDLKAKLLKYLREKEISTSKYVEDLINEDFERRLKK